MDRESGESLAPLRELNATVAEGSPDTRGWEVIAADGTPIGRVEDLLVDTAAMEVRYLLVTLRQEHLQGSSARTVRVPVANSRLDSGGRRVYLDTLSASDAASLARHSSTSEPADDRTLVQPPAPDATSSEREVRMTLSEEELDIRKRVVSSGEVEVRKRVEAEQVREVVPRMREDVSIERRPVPPGLADFNPRVEGDVIYVPLVQEELVIEKRLVAREELVIRKRQVIEEQVVEATLQREVPDVRGRDGEVRAG
jgi:uncharacterized protein (TIGR02271 family)